MSKSTAPLRILVTGDRAAGKTTLCLKAAEALRRQGVTCGGVVCPKACDETGTLVGIEVLDLAEEPPPRERLAVTDRVLDGPSTGAFHFSKRGLRFGEQALTRAAREAGVVFADELGILEMREEGFTNLLALARDASIATMVIVVRPSLIEQVSAALRPLPLWLVEVEPSNRGKALEVLVRILLERTGRSAHPQGG
jgi:nucleoside-triphosphatase THEP1